LGNSHQNLGFSSQNLRTDFGVFVIYWVNKFRRSENFEDVSLTNEYQAKHRAILPLTFGED